MGGAMATHLVESPGGLIVSDVRAEAMAPLVEAGATAAADLGELAAASDVISIMVLDDAQVRDVVSRLLPAAKPGTVIAIHSTIRAQTAIDLAATAAESGIDVVDAPVSGGFMGAHAGNLATMVGGSDEAVAKVRPSFETWADLIVHLGPVGAGTRAKLARNLLHFISFTAATEAQRLAEASGISLRKLARVVRHTDAITGGAGSIMLRDTTAPLQPGDDWYDVLLHVRTLGEKDLSLALEQAAELGVDLPLGRVALAEFADGLGVPHRGDPTAEGTTA